MVLLVMFVILAQDEGWDFGTGAGFYVDATEPKWKEHVRLAQFASLYHYRAQRYRLLA